MLIACDCSPHHLSATTCPQEDSPGVDPPRYVSYVPKSMLCAKGCSGIVVGVAVGAAFYSMGRKLLVDKTMRLNRQNRKE
jgi:hypothetical protein